MSSPSIGFRRPSRFVRGLALACAGLSLGVAGIVAAASASAPSFDGLWQDCERYQGEDYCESLQLSRHGETIRAAWNWRASRSGGTDLFKGRIVDGRAVFETPGCEITAERECRPRENREPVPMVLLICGRHLHWLHDRERGCAQLQGERGYRRVEARALQAEALDFAGFDFFRQP